MELVLELVLEFQKISRCQKFKKTNPEKSQKNFKFQKNSKNRKNSIVLKILKSLINNRMVAKPLAPGAFKAGSNGWDWSMGLIQDPWYAVFHPRAARFLVE